MNPLGGIVALLGLVLVVVGLKGTQRNLAGYLSGARPSQLSSGGKGGATSYRGVAYSGTAPITGSGVPGSAPRTPGNPAPVVAPPLSLGGGGAPPPHFT